jgi:hypothetical protein
VLHELGEGRSEKDDEQPCRPTEQDDGGDAEHKRQGDAAGVHPVDRHGESIGERRGDEQGGQPEQRRRGVRIDGERGDRGDGHARSEETHGRDDREQAAREAAPHRGATSTG